VKQKTNHISSLAHVLQGLKRNSAIPTANYRINPDEASTLIPGLVRSCRTNWCKIEIGSHIKDPDRTVYRLMSQMRSPHARKMEPFGNSKRLKGTNVIIKAYDKTTEMVAKKYSTRANLDPSTDDPITRLEVELWGKKVANFSFLLEEQRPLTRLEDGKTYLEGFTLDQLRAIFRYYFSELKALYHAPKMPGGGDAAGMAAVLAAVHLRMGMPIEELCILYTERGMRARKKSRTKDEEEKALKRAHGDMRNKIERNIEKSSMLTADELLSDSANRNQPIIDVKGTYGVGELFVQHYGIDSIRDFAIDPHADRQIKEV
jgi:hypothetical protein